MREKPNVVMIVVDQMRFDCIGANMNEYISTPNIDMLAENGYNFQNCYSAVPTCIAARAALMTGLSQKNHGRVGYQDRVEWNYSQTIGKSFKEEGYQTYAIGKMHVFPERSRLGFDHVELHDGYLHTNRNFNRDYASSFEQVDDYLVWLKEQQGFNADITDNGIDCNSWVAKPWLYNEELHPTNWVSNQGIKFLKKRDTTTPYFLKMSFVRPHSPLDPPKYYFDMYLNQEKHPINIGDWAKGIGKDGVYDVNSITSKYNSKELERMRSAYYGLITHIDHQIGRFLIALNESGEYDNTIILFTSDHGDQLGEHHLLRKAFPYQGSVHVPLIIYDPRNKIENKPKKIFELTELRDIYPTLIAVACGKQVEGIDGRSLIPVISGLKKNYDYIHGEHSFGEHSSQYIVTKKWKYIWYSQTGVEQLFNLEKDPNECINVIYDNNEKVINKLRKVLISELKGREEGFVVNGKLCKTLNTVNSLKFLIT